MDLLWRERFRVHFYDADPRGRATLPALCRFFQVAADRHVRRIGASLADLLAAGRMWVLTELSMTVDRFPSIDEEVSVETWGARRMGGARAYRDFLLTDAHGGRLGAATSLWLYLDEASRRPLRLPGEIMAFRVADRDPVLRDEPGVLVPPVNAAGETTVRVGWHDLDQNRHANNVRYIEWALAAVPVSVWEGRQPSGLSVRFLAEVRLDQVVHSAVEVVENGSELETRHELRTEDGRSVALARTTWRSSDR